MLKGKLLLLLGASVLLLALLSVFFRGPIVFVWSQLNMPRHRSLYHQAESAFTWEDCERIARAKEKIPYCPGTLSNFVCATPESVFTSTFTGCLGLAARNSNNPNICFDEEIINKVLVKLQIQEPRPRDAVRDTCIRGYLGDEKFDPRFKENKNITDEERRQILARLCQEIETEGYYKNKACTSQ